MSTDNKLDAARAAARREWLGVFDEHIAALTGDNRHGELVARLVILNGLPRYVEASRQQRSDLAGHQ